jgi:dihydroorotase
VRVNPPLRGRSDVEAVREGLVDGTIDAIASDHAPHSLEEKQVEFDAAPPGMTGVETLLPVTLSYLVKPGFVSLDRAVELMTADPANILGIRAGSLEVGVPADVVAFDPDLGWTPARDWFKSKSKNSPFVGRPLTGRARLTIVRGEVVFEEQRTGAEADGRDAQEEDRDGARELSLLA